MEVDIEPNATQTLYSCPVPGCDTFRSPKMTFVHTLCNHPQEYLKLKRQGYQQLIQKLPGVVCFTVHSTIIEQEEKRTNSILRTEADSNGHDDELVIDGKFCSGAHSQPRMKFFYFMNYHMYAWP